MSIFFARGQRTFAVMEYEARPGLRERAPGGFVPARRRLYLGSADGIFLILVLRQGEAPARIFCSGRAFGGRFCPGSVPPFLLAATSPHHLLLSCTKHWCFVADKTRWWCRARGRPHHGQDPVVSRATGSRLPQLWGQCSLSPASPEVTRPSQRPRPPLPASRAAVPLGANMPCHHASGESWLNGKLPNPQGRMALMT